MKLHYMDTLKSPLTAFYPMKLHLVSDEFLPHHSTCLTFYACYSIWCQMNFLLVIPRFSHTLHLVFMVERMMSDEIRSRELSFLTYTAISSSLFSCLVDHMMPDEITPRHYTFSHSIHALSYSLSSIDLSFLSGQGLPLASDNVKYWCLVRCPPGSLQLLSACRYNCFGHYLMIILHGYVYVY